MNCKQLQLSSLLLASSAIGTGYAAESIKEAGKDSDLAEARQYLDVKDGGEEIKARAPFTLTLKGRWHLADGMDPKSAREQPAPSGVDTLLVVAASAPAGNPVRLVLN